MQKADIFNIWPAVLINSNFHIFKLRVSEFRNLDVLRSTETQSSRRAMEEEHLPEDGGYQKPKAVNAVREKL